MRNVNDAREESVVETRNAKHDGDVIQPRKIPAQDESNLKHDRQSAGPIAERRGREVEPRHHKLSKVSEEHAGLVSPTRRMMEIPAQRVGQGLSFIMVKEAGQIAPAWIGAQFDHACAEHGAEKHPHDEPHHNDRRARIR